MITCVSLFTAVLDDPDVEVDAERKAAIRDSANSEMVISLFVLDCMR